MWHPWPTVQEMSPAGVSSLADIAEVAPSADCDGDVTAGVTSLEECGNRGVVLSEYVHNYDDYHYDCQYYDRPGYYEYDDCHSYDPDYDDNYDHHEYDHYGDSDHCGTYDHPCRAPAQFRPLIVLRHRFGILPIAPRLMLLR